MKKILLFLSIIFISTLQSQDFGLEKLETKKRDLLKAILLTTIIWDTALIPISLLGANIAKDFAKISIELNHLESKLLPKDGRLWPKIARQFRVGSGIGLSCAFIGSAGWHTYQAINSSFDLLAIKRTEKERELQKK